MTSNKALVAAKGVELFDAARKASVAFVATNPWLIYSACPNIDPSEIAGVDYNYLEGGQAMSTRSFGLTVNITF